MSVNFIIDVICKDGELKSFPLTWDLLIHAGSPEDKLKYNEIRKKYVVKLQTFLNTKNICDRQKKCSPQSVGTSGNITYESDVDINLQFSTNFINENIDNISELYEKIDHFHNEYFKKNYKINTITNYTELFDINLYGTQFNVSEACKLKNKTCISLLDNNQTQRLWAMSRFVELCPDYDTDDQLFKQAKSIFVDKKTNDIVTLTRDMLKDIPAIKNKYIKELQTYFEVIKKADDINKSANALSLAKYYENETYRSVGAFLHIVVKQPDLSNNLYMDSFMDNFGFAIYNLSKTNACVDIPLQWKMLRVAKYMDRMIDALLLSKSVKKIKHLRKLQKICIKLNNLRKSGGNNKIIIKNINLLLLNLNSSEEDIQQKFIEFAFSYYKIQK